MFFLPGTSSLVVLNVKIVVLGPGFGAQVTNTPGFWISHNCTSKLPRHWKCFLYWIVQCFTSPPTRHKEDGFNRSKDPTNGIKVLKEMLQKTNQTTKTTKYAYEQTIIGTKKDIHKIITTSPLVYTNMGWLGDSSHRRQVRQVWTAVGLLPRYPQVCSVQQVVVIKNWQLREIKNQNAERRCEPTLSVLEVVPPQRTDLVLTSDVPHSETDVLVLHCLHIETYQRHHNSLQLQDARTDHIKMCALYPQMCAFHRSFTIQQKCLTWTQKLSVVSLI